MAELVQEARPQRVHQWAESLLVQVNLFKDSAIIIPLAIQRQAHIIPQPKKLWQAHHFSYTAKTAAGKKSPTSSN